MLTDYDKDPFPNPNPTRLHGVWTEWGDEHDQKSLSKTAVYLLRHNIPTPEGGVPFFVEQTHPSDGSSARYTQEWSKARRFRGTYLLRTMWNWEWENVAVPV